jgi:AraC family transcriptional regulator, arabinose operon regulatory protein
MFERAKSPVVRETAEGKQPLTADHRVQKVIQAIATDPSYTIPDLARMVNLSSSRLAHLFKIVVGSNLQTVLSDARLERAATMLQATEMPVKEISYSVGYRHSPSFVRAFRKKFRYSPNDYRSQQRILLTNS